MLTERRSLRPNRPRPFLQLSSVLAAGLITLAACSSDKMLAPRVLDHHAVKDDVPVDTTNALAATVSNHFAYWRLVSPPGSFTAHVFDAVTPSTFAFMRVSRFNIGDYTTEVPLMSSAFHPGNKETVITTTYGATTVQCVALGWSSEPDQDFFGVRTLCNDMRGGRFVDQEFASLVVGNNSVSGTHAFAYATRPTAASYTPDTATSFTTGTGRMLIERTAVGDYNVTLGTGSPNGSTYLVSAVSAQAVCGVGSWRTSGVRVRCFDGTGAPVDARFTVLQIAGGRFSTVCFGCVFPIAFAWADKPSSKSTFTPNAAHSASASGPMSVTRTSVGQYEIRFANLQNPFFDPENVQVTTFGTTYAACTVVSRSDEASARLVRVQCLDAKAAPTDSRFNITLMR